MEQPKLEAPITVPSSTIIKPQSSLTNVYMNTVDDQVKLGAVSFPSEYVDETGDHEYIVGPTAVSESYVPTPRDHLRVMLDQSQDSPAI